MAERIETDSMGPIAVPAEHYWGAQTQRSLIHFNIGDDLIPREVIRGFAVLKKACALANRGLGKLDPALADAICAACDEILAGKFDGEFPLKVWMTGSGTQSNMNANEVIARRANELAGERLCHPNDDVNMSQSSNDTFPTALHIAAVLSVEDRLLPADPLALGQCT